MRILINAAGARIGGAVTYLSNVLPVLEECNAGGEIFVLAPEPTAAALERGRAGSRSTFLPCRAPAGMHPRRAFLDHIGVPRLLRRHAIDVLYSSNGFGTFVGASPQILLIRNALYFSPTLAEHYRFLGKRLGPLNLRRQWSILSMRAADLIVFPSRAMLDLAGRAVDLAGKPLQVIHYGFDAASFAAGGLAEPPIGPRMRHWRDTGYTVVLSTCTFAAHKNLETLVRSLPRLRRTGARLKLVLTISRAHTTDKEEYDSLMALVRDLDLRDTVVTAGHLPYQQMHWLYRNADIYAYPSFCESFGHPLLEAMASGLPIVAADTPVNREVAGTAAVYFEAFDPASCAARVSAVLSDGALCRTLATRGREEVGRWSWRGHVEALYATFAALSAEGRSRR